MPSAQARARDIRSLHAQIRLDIERERGRIADRERGLVAGGRTMELVRPQQEMRDQVDFGVKAVDKLLNELDDQTKADDLTDAQLYAATAQPDEPEPEVDLLDEVQTLRALASDDTSLETPSDNDYASDPPAAPNFTTTSIVEIINELERTHGKMLDSVATIRDILQSSPHWWAGPIPMRRLKTHCIRINFHARKFKKWGNQCRAHLFVSSSILNRAGLEASADLRELRSQLDLYTKRKERLRVKRQRLLKIEDDIQQTGEELTKLHAALEPTLISRAAACLADNTATEGAHASPPVLSVDASESVLLLVGLKRVFPEISDDVETLLRYYADFGTPSGS